MTTPEPAAIVRPTGRPPDHAEATAPPVAVTRLLLAAAGTAAVADLAWMLLIGEPIPPLVVFAVLVGAAAVGLRARPRARAITLGVLAVLVLAMGRPFFVAEASHPEDLGGFAWAVLSGGGRIVTIVAAGLALRAPRLARPVARVATATAAALLTVSVVATATTTSDAPVDGDVVVAASANTFPERIEVAAGGGLLVDNEDRWRHTFSVVDADVDVDLPPAAARRVEVDLAPGEYRVHCTVHGHEAMTSVLVVR